MQILYVIDNDQSKYVLVDDEDLERCLRYNWSFNQHTGYLRATNFPGGAVELHKVIVGPAPEGYTTDHKNRNKLDNRKENLQFVTYSQNGINSKRTERDDLHIRKTPSGTFRVMIKRNGKYKSYGSWSSFELAKSMRDSILDKEKQNGLSQ